jgi:hypothetical protein
MSHSKSENILNEVVLDRGKFHRFHENIYIYMSVCACVRVCMSVRCVCARACGVYVCGVCMCAHGVSCVCVCVVCMCVRAYTLGFFIVRHE